MDEILDDDAFEIGKIAKVSFLRWWERKRFLLNLFAFVSLVVFFISIEAFSMLTNFQFFLLYFIVINITYSVSLLLAYSFKWIIRKIDTSFWNYFSQNLILWKFFFVLHLLLTILIFLVIVGGGSATAPFPPSPGF